MEARDAELKKELDATLHARRELGEEYDSALVDSFLGKVEQRLDGTIDRRMRRHLAEQQMVVARGARSPASGVDSWAERFGFGVVSLILAVPLSAIAVVNAGLTGLFVSWAGIVGVNAVCSFRGLSFRRHREDRKSEWDD
ncbi:MULTISPECIES: hypothetical protein [Streptomyces]|uniref:Integral membrane protein n=1 Tax=Streptomyces venezuelae TaxID=54571 RepID=A0A5P2BBG9_STRVZ|nr:MULTISPECIES: hypothetical protein [Streptomyces]NDZ99271.1 hypothetical protein [Streptomyces sp. SID10116]MYY85025.1 hypothetical protein [Streptomyces sp. SID335]MYZ18289.1 hypothetical protein [Streptomyces sp. SID337]NDZ92163.1 hypothetical protein [Streptomyces sp. SID10115]NEB43708.1 hypothetical protein [Streptomyces sp. SID339]